MFINPAPYGYRENKSTDKKAYFSSYPNEKIVAPYDGIVVKSDPNECGGNIVIQHIIKGENFFSEFCQVGRITALSGARVLKSDIIGFFGSNPVEFIISDSRKNKMNINDFYSSKMFDNKSNKEDKKEKEEKKKDKDLEYKKKSEEPVLYDTFLDAFLTPFTLMGKPFKGDMFKKQTNEEFKRLEEEVKRIKTLLK
jgi:hypothetical protein